MISRRGEKPNKETSTGIYPGCTQSAKRAVLSYFAATIIFACSLFTLIFLLFIANRIVSPFRRLTDTTQPQPATCNRATRAAFTNQNPLSWRPPRWIQKIGSDPDCRQPTLMPWRRRRQPRCPSQLTFQCRHGVRIGAASQTSRQTPYSLRLPLRRLLALLAYPQPR